MIKSLDKGMTVLCRSWYQCYLSLFHSPSPSVVFLLLISLHQNARNKKGERKKLPHGLFMGPADKMLTWKLRRIYGAAWSFCDNCSLAFIFRAQCSWVKSMCSLFFVLCSRLNDWNRVNPFSSTVSCVRRAFFIYFFISTLTLVTHIDTHWSVAAGIR